MVYRVYDSRIDSLFTPNTTDLGRFGNTILRQSLVYARNLAPDRSGRLKRSHRSRGYLKRGPYNLAAKVENFAPYALFVHEGTTGPIFAKGSKSLVVPARTNRGSAFIYTGTKNIANIGRLVVTRDSVAGQAANPWLEEAVELAATYARYVAR